jgi:hypothetical protein
LLNTSIAGSQKVEGSNPSGSTIKLKALSVAKNECFLTI